MVGADATCLVAANPDNVGEGPFMRRRPQIHPHFGGDGVLIMARSLDLSGFSKHPEFSPELKCRILGGSCFGGLLFDDSDCLLRRCCHRRHSVSTEAGR